MKQIGSRGRLFLRRIFSWLSVGAISFVSQSQACTPLLAPMYGVPSVNVSGTVKASDTNEPIKGIQVSEKEGFKNYVLTGNGGEFELKISLFNHVLLFEDIDGPANGEFKDKEIEWQPEDGHLDVKLDPK